MRLQLTNIQVLYQDSSKPKARRSDLLAVVLLSGSALPRDSCFYTYVSDRINKSSTSCCGPPRRFHRNAEATLLVEESSVVQSIRHDPSLPVVRCDRPNRTAHSNCVRQL